MEFTTEELALICKALMEHHKGRTELLDAIELEIEKRELEFMDFGDPNDCGDACKL